MMPYAAVDVSSLNDHVGHLRSQIWWGNTLLLVIETTMFGVLAASYLYVRRNFDVWPPPRVERDPVLYDADPSLLVPTLALLVLVALAWPMRRTDVAAANKEYGSVVRGLAVTMAGLVVMLVLRAFEFPALHFRWDDNAYGSVVWILLGTHLLHVIVALLEALLLFLWVRRHGIDDKHARDVRVWTRYGYWVVAVWLPLYALLYLAPQAF